MARLVADAAAYLQLTKPRVVALIVFTAVVGMFLAVPGMPPASALVFGTLGIGLAASSAAGEGPSGFSFEASLMESRMPRSRMASMAWSGSMCTGGRVSRWPCSLIVGDGFGWRFASR